MQIDEFDIRRIKDAAGILDVMRDFIPDIRKAGADYECLCPFHNDRHLGSFKISPRRNTYRCFSCGKHGGPVDFLMDYGNMTFQDAICYLGAKYGMPIEGSDTYHPLPAKPHTPPPPLPMLVLPTEYVKIRQDISEDTLCKWIRNLPWDKLQKERVEKTLKNYLVGHSKDGHTIFWQMDENGQLRTGKMMLYKPDGHRDRESKGNFSWIHTRLEKAGKYDPEQYEMKTTFFGMHLIDYYPDATINIVESEKTALLCSIYYGYPESNLWLACGGLSMLSYDRLLPLFVRGRRISLLPDHDSIEKWTKIAHDISWYAIDFGYEPNMSVQTTFVERNWREEDGEKADIADMLVRLLCDSRAGKVQKVNEVISQFRTANPFFGKLVDRLQLEPIIQA